MTYFDFNSASEQTSFDLIPKGTLLRVRMTIKPGGFDDPSQGWTGGYATRNDNTGSVYLNCEFVVMEGEFARRKMWSLIGLHSPKGPEWANMRRTFVKAILKTPIVVNDSRGFYTSRVFSTYVGEGLALLAEGVKPALIDNAGRMAGMPVGPLALADDSQPTGFDRAV